MSNTLGGDLKPRILELVARLSGRTSPRAPTYTAQNEAGSVAPDEAERLRTVSAEQRPDVAATASLKPRTSASYAFPWPDALPGLGDRRVGPFDHCADCERGFSWVRYGGVVLCLSCALQRGSG